MTSGTSGSSSCTSNFPDIIGRTSSEYYCSLVNDAYLRLQLTRVGCLLGIRVSRRTSSQGRAMGR